MTKPGSRTNTPVDLTCLYPTLTKLCGLPVPESLDGVISDLLKNPDAEWTYPAIIDFLKGNTAIRTQGWRYIRYDEGRAGEELYDLVNDPNEWSNLFATHKELATPFKAWLPENYANEVPTKRAYSYDSDNYSWSRME